ncbi:protein GRIM REAPER [Heracleum sosnowskyi]|uniref:Protein GRIM REAPER n=1 Tax=Heracleum sosnowskyi TaxID=360622 RepID=A0AAD8JNL0_9APIA|nr:protein GRIM REAPER [Heracleum sosnowskyi]
MASNNLLKLATILSILTILFISSSSQNSLDDEEYVLDTPLAKTNLRSRFLASKKVIKKGTTCSQSNKYVCNGVWANNGTSLLYCCKTHCRNVVGDMNNCGQCGYKCAYGQRCCGGTCTNVDDDDTHCGKCGNTCSHGVKCENGFCGYA